MTNRIQTFTGFSDSLAQIGYRRMEILKKLKMCDVSPKETFFPSPQPKMTFASS